MPAASCPRCCSAWRPSAASAAASPCPHTPNTPHSSCSRSSSSGFVVSMRRASGLASRSLDGDRKAHRRGVLHAAAPACQSLARLTGGRADRDRLPRLLHHVAAIAQEQLVEALLLLGGGAGAALRAGGLRQGIGAQRVLELALHL